MIFTFPASILKLYQSIHHYKQKDIHEAAVCCSLSIPAVITKMNTLTSVMLNNSFPEKEKHLNFLKSSIMMNTAPRLHSNFYISAY